MDKMKKLWKKLIAMYIGIAVFITAIPAIPVHAEEMEDTEPQVNPVISVSNQTIAAGNYGYLYVSASDFVNLAGLEFSVYYDSDVITVKDCYIRGFDSSSMTDINRKNAGEIKCSIMNVEGLNGNGEILSIYYKVNDDAELGDTKITLAVNGAYDINMNPITVGKKSGTITVTEPQQSLQSVYFYNNLDKQEVEEGEIVTYYLYSGNTYDLSAGDFIFEYDKEYLEFQDIALGKEILTGTAAYSINRQNEGYVKITYADVEAISAGWGTEFFKLTFKAKENVNGQTTIGFSTKSLMSEKLAAMTADKRECTLTIREIPEEEKYPEMVLALKEEDATTRTAVFDLILPKDAAVAAGDFTVTYDGGKIICTEVTLNKEVTSSGGLIITNEKIGEGKVKFSYVMSEPFEKEIALVSLKFQIKEDAYGKTILKTGGTGVVDKGFEDIRLEYLECEYQLPGIGIGSLSCTISQSSYVYDGNAKKPSVTVKGLKQGTDYTVSYQDNVNAGTAKVIVTGCGKYSGTITKTFEIKKENIGKKAVVLSGTYTYDGTQKTPEVTITGLSKDCDYTVTYGDNTDAGTATVVITGCGNYEGTVEKTFEILQADISNITAELLEEFYVYDGTEKEPELTVEGLLEGKDYTVIYSDNTDAGIAKVVIRGCGNYKGEIVKTFIIRAASIESMEVTLSENILEYDGTEKEPEVYVKGLTKGKDYTADYFNNINAGTAKVIVTGCGNYQGSITAEFEISPCFHEWDNGTITVEVKCEQDGEIVYTCYKCKEEKTEIQLAHGHKPSGLYTFTKLPDCVNGAELKIFCEYGCGHIYDMQTIETFPLGHKHDKTIVTKATTKADGKIETACSRKDCGNVDTSKTKVIYKPSNMTLSTTTYTYDGKVKSPSVTVKDSKGNTLKKDTDYTVSYASGRKNVGKYAVKVTFKGNYSGTMTQYLTINPKATTLSGVTAASKAFTAKWKKQSTQVTGYQIQYSTSKAFTSAKTVTVSSYKTTSNKISKLSAKKTYYVRIRTYKTVGSSKFYSGWSAYKSVKTK